MNDVSKAEVIGAAIVEYRKNRSMAYINHISNLDVYLGMIETERKFPGADGSPEGLICRALLDILDNINYE